MSSLEESQRGSRRIEYLFTNLDVKYFTELIILGATTSSYVRYSLKIRQNALYGASNKFAELEKTPP